MPKPSVLRKQLTEELGDKSCDAALEEQRKLLAEAEARISQAYAAADAQDRLVEEMEARYEEARAEVNKQLVAEEQARKKIHEANDKKAVGMKRVKEARKVAIDAQKKCALLEVLALNAEKTRVLAEKRRVASEAAIAAKRLFVEQRQQEKASLKALARELAKKRKVRGTSPPAKQALVWDRRAAASSSSSSSGLCAPAGSAVTQPAAEDILPVDASLNTMSLNTMPAKPSEKTTAVVAASDDSLAGGSAAALKVTSVVSLDDEVYDECTVVV